MTDAEWHILTLEDRLDFVILRLNDHAPGRKTFTKAERAALQWALAILKPLVESQRPMSTDDRDAVETRRQRMADRGRGFRAERARRDARATAETGTGSGSGT